MKLPIWSAYLIAPALILAFSWRMLVTSESRGVIAVYAVVAGLFCAVVVHAYVWVRSQFSGKNPSPPK